MFLARSYNPLTLAYCPIYFKCVIWMQAGPRRRLQNAPDVGDFVFRLRDFKLIQPIRSRCECGSEARFGAFHSGLPLVRLRRVELFHHTERPGAALVVARSQSSSGVYSRAFRSIPTLHFGLTHQGIRFNEFPYNAIHVPRTTDSRCSFSSKFA
jgi:hypothetical protein